MRILFAIILLAIFAMYGCSDADRSVIPSSQDNNPSSTFTNLPLMVDEFDTNGNTISGSGMLGIFNASIDAYNLTGELAPLRISSLDDALEMVDITNFLSLAPCTDCVKLFSIELDTESRIVAKIGIRHPFEAGDPLKPITGRNRADLHVFNVEGTVVFDDSSGSTGFPGMGNAIGPSYLANPDGYSPYMDIALDDIYSTVATVHPYVLHFDDYTEGNFNPGNPMGFASVTDPSPSGNLVMAMGCDYDVKDYIFNVPGGESFDFIFAVGCTYAVSAASKSMRFNPEYQIPQHNKKAASEVSVEITNNELQEGNTSSSAQLTIKVLDINHGIAVGSALDEMKADSSVSSIYVEVPGVTSGIVGGPATPTGGDGRDPLNPLTFEISFTNAQGGGEGVYTGLVKVLDAYATGQNESPLLNGMDAIKRVGPIENPLTGLYALDEFATYMTFVIEVAGNQPPVASFDTNPVGSPDLTIDQFTTVVFTSTSTDPDDPLTPEGQIVSYEWDFEWDGIPSNFNDDTGGTGSDIESHNYSTQGIFRAGLRVSDAGIPPATSAIYSIQITVTEAGCGDQVHEHVGIYNLTGVSFNSNIFMGDLGYFSAGPHAGKIVTQYNYGNFCVFSPQAADQAVTQFNSQASYSTNFFSNIDTCPMTGRLFASHLYTANLWDPNGNNLGTWNDGSSTYIQAVEIDNNGDLWAVVRIDTSLYLRHYLYSASAPYYQKPAAHETDLTSMYPPNQYWGCIDLAKDFQTNKMFLFMGRFSSGENRVAVFDVSSGTASLLTQRSNVFTRNIDLMIGGNPYPYYIRRADIDIDHTAPEYCRVVVGAHTLYGTVFHYELVRLDDELNTIDFYDGFQSAPGASINTMPQAFTIADVGAHPLITAEFRPNQFRYFESPDW